MVCDKYVLRLQVAVVDSQGVAVSYGIQELEKDMLAKSIVSNKSAMLGNVREEVAFRAELDHDKRAVRAVEDAM